MKHWGVHVEAVQQIRRKRRASIWRVVVEVLALGNFESRC